MTLCALCRVVLPWSCMSEHATTVVACPSKGLGACTPRVTPRLPGFVHTSADTRVPTNSFCSPSSRAIAAAGSLATRAASWITDDASGTQRSRTIPSAAKLACRWVRWDTDKGSFTHEVRPRAPVRVRVKAILGESRSGSGWSCTPRTIYTDVCLASLSWCGGVETRAIEGLGLSSL